MHCHYKQNYLCLLVLFSLPISLAFTRYRATENCFSVDRGKREGERKAGQMGLKTKTKTKDLAHNAFFGADSSATTIISPRTDQEQHPEQVRFLFFFKNNS
jgi:hypothetical protein